MSSKSENSAVISTTLGGNDGSEKFVPENEASSDEEFCPSHENTTNTNNLQNAPDEDLKLSQICPTTAGTGYTKCDISTLRFTQESTLYNFKLLTDLNISNFKNIRDLPKLVENLPKLKSLQADNCGLTTVVDVPFPVGLRFLSLAYNEIAAMPVLMNLPYLETINLASNRLDTFYSQIFEECYSIRDINASNNEITEAEFTNFGECLVLETLNLAHNQLKNDTTCWPETSIGQLQAGLKCDFCGQNRAK